MGARLESCRELGPEERGFAVDVIDNDAHDGAWQNVSIASPIYDWSGARGQSEAGRGENADARSGVLRSGLALASARGTANTNGRQVLSGLWRAICGWCLGGRLGLRESTAHACEHERQQGNDVSCSSGFVGWHSDFALHALIVAPFRDTASTHRVFQLRVVAAMHAVGTAVLIVLAMASTTGMARAAEAQALVCDDAVTSRVLERANALLAAGALEGARAAFGELVSTSSSDCVALEASAQEAEILLKLGRHPDARARLETLLEKVRLRGSNALLARVLGSLGKATLLHAAERAPTSNSDRGVASPGGQREARLDRAQVLFQQSIEVAARAGLKSIEGASRVNLAQLQYMRGRRDHAEKQLQDLLSGMRGTSPTLLSVGAQLSLAEWKCESRGAGGALAPVSSELGSLPVSAAKLELMIRLAKLQAGCAFNDVAALTTLKDVYQRAGGMGDKRAASVAAGLIAGILDRRGEHGEAEVQTRLALAQLVGLDVPELSYRWHWQLGKILARDPAQREKAKAAYAQAVLLVSELRDDLSQDERSTVSSFRKVFEPLFLEYAGLRFATRQGSTSQADVQKSYRETRDTMERLKSVELQDYYGDECVVAMLRQARRIDDVLPSGTAALYPILLEDRIELLVTFSGGAIFHATSKVERAAFEATVRKFRLSLESRDDISGYKTSSVDLYNHLIRPVLGALRQNEVKTIVFIPDGELRTIPLAALNDGRGRDGFLIEEFAVATNPGLNLLDPQPFPRNKISVLVSGLTEEVPPYDRLPGVREELAGLEKTFSAKSLKDSNFTVTTVSSELSETAFQVVHMATHGHFDPDPSKSYLLAHSGPNITLDLLERLIKQTRFRRNPVELLFLSACETAAGDDQAALGLAGIAVKSGARSVVATLWQVQDEATPRLVTKFYSELKNTKNSKAEALRQAQLSLLKEGQFSHPGYWAPFLLIGNWM